MAIRYTLMTTTKPQRTPWRPPRLEQVGLALAITAAAEDPLRVEHLAEPRHGEPGPAEMRDHHEGGERERQVTLEPPRARRGLSPRRG